MGVVVEAVHELLDVLVDHGVAQHFAVPIVQFVRGRQFAVQQQEGHLEKRAVLGELFDRITAIAEDAVIAIEVGNCALA